MKTLFRLLYFNTIISKSVIAAYNTPQYTHDLARDNFGLVPYFAKPFIVKHKLNKYQCQELIQEGSIGLIYACRKYDEKHKTKFSTYSSYWIKSYMSRYIKTLYKNKASFCLKEDRYIETDSKSISLIDLDVLEEEERYFIQKKYFERMTIKKLAIYFNVPQHFIITYNKRLIIKMKSMKSKMM